MFGCGSGEPCAGQGEGEHPVSWLICSAASSFCIKALVSFHWLLPWGASSPAASRVSAVPAAPRARQQAAAQAMVPAACRKAASPRKALASATLASPPSPPRLLALFPDQRWSCRSCLHRCLRQGWPRGASCPWLRCRDPTRGSGCSGGGSARAWQMHEASGAPASRDGLSFPIPLFQLSYRHVFVTNIHRGCPIFKAGDIINDFSAQLWV